MRKYSYREMENLFKNRFYKLEKEAWPFSKENPFLNILKKNKIRIIVNSKGRFDASRRLIKCLDKNGYKGSMEYLLVCWISKRGILDKVTVTGYLTLPWKPLGHDVYKIVNVENVNVNQFAGLANILANTNVENLSKEKGKNPPLIEERLKEWERMVENSNKENDGDRGEVSKHDRFFKDFLFCELKIKEGPHTIVVKHKNGLTITISESNYSKFKSVVERFIGKGNRGGLFGLIESNLSIDMDGILEKIFKPNKKLIHKKILDGMTRANQSLYMSSSNDNLLNSKFFEDLTGRIYVIISLYKDNVHRFSAPEVPISTRGMEPLETYMSKLDISEKGIRKFKLKVIECLKNSFKEDTRGELEDFLEKMFSKIENPAAQRRELVSSLIAHRVMERYHN